MHESAHRLGETAAHTGQARLALLFVLFTMFCGFGLGGAVRPAQATPAAETDGQPALPLAQAAPAGQMVKAPDMVSDAEVLRFTDDLVPTLLKVAAGKKVRIADWPVAPGVRQDVLITRHQIYAPGAHILLVDAAGTHEVPRSRLAFFWGVEADNGTVGLSVAVDPATGTIEGLTQTGSGMFQLRQVEGRTGTYLLAGTEATRVGAGLPARPAWHCGEETLVPLPRPPVTTEDRDAATARNAQALQAAAAMPGATVQGGASYNMATVAFDTDNEFMAKFSNNTTTTTNYIASLVAATNVMYERDLGVELLVGTTYLRTTSEPYTAEPDPDANAAQLSEFTNYWSTNYGTVARTVAALLSGKETDGALSGIAWISGLCSTSYGYSVNDLLGTGYIDYDQLILGHELGHNFGTNHTHCYNPPIDTCYNQQSGCYDGAATSCPAATTLNGVTGVTGTMMSYCDLLGSCGVSMVFHPRVVAVIKPEVTSALGLCMTAGSGGTTGGGSGTAFYTATPCRIVDTRTATGPEGGPNLTAGQQRVFQITGQCGIPTGATAVSVNATVIGGTIGGSINLFAGNGSSTGTNTVSFGAGQVRANNAVVQLASDGSGTLAVLNSASATTQFVLDVNGYFK
jgi:Metallo-peptidase family M12